MALVPITSANVVKKQNGNGMNAAVNRNLTPSQREEKAARRRAHKEHQAASKAALERTEAQPVLVIQSPEVSNKCKW